MKPLASIILLAVLWGLGLGSEAQLGPILPQAASSWLQALSMFIVLLIVPGWGLGRFVGGVPTRRGSADLFETQFATLATSFATSLGIAALVATICSFLAAPVLPILIATLAACGLFLAVPNTQRSFSGSANARARWSQVVLLAGFTTIAAASAVGGENLSLPTLWTFAESTRIAVTGYNNANYSLLSDCASLFPAGGHAWTTALAAWVHAAGVDPVFAFERVLPLILTVLVSSAGLAFAHALVPAGMASSAATLSLVALMCTASPHLPEGAIPAHLATPSVLALTIVLPVLLASFVLVYFPRRGDSRTPTEPLVVGLSLLGLGSTSAACVPLLGLACGALALAAQRRESRGFTLELSRARINLLLLIAVSAWALPAVFVTNDRSLAISELPLRALAVGGSVASALSFEPLGFVGTILDPRTFGHPLFLLALAGAAAGLRRRRGRRSTIVRALLLTAALTTVVPPMAGLWSSVAGIGHLATTLAFLPIGVLLLMFAEQTVAIGNGSRGHTALAAILVATWVSLAGIQGFPLERLGRSNLHQILRGPMADPELVGILKEVRQLPEDATVAVAGDLGALVAGLTGHRVLAADPATTQMFSESDRTTADSNAAQRRLTSAALAALSGGSPFLREQLAAESQASHIILEGFDCDSTARLQARHGRFQLCQFVAAQNPAWDRNAGNAPTPAPSERARLLAQLGDGWTCHPATNGEGTPGAHRWVPQERWSGRATAVRCSLALLPATESEQVSLVFDSQQMPTTVAYRLRSYSQENGDSEKSGVSWTEPDGALRIPVPDPTATSLQLVLTTGDSELSLSNIELWGSGEFEVGVAPDSGDSP